MTLSEVLKNFREHENDCDGSLTIAAAKKKATQWDNAILYCITNADNWCDFTACRITFYEAVPIGYLIERLANQYNLSLGGFIPIERKVLGKWRKELCENNEKETQCKNY